MMRIGIGFDIHRFAAGRKLVLGGVEINYEKGLLGHSDGDCLLHAIADAILGALGLGDIGCHFSPGDPKWKDVDSKVILSKVADMVEKNKYEIVNIDSNIVAERPRMQTYIPEMKRAISQCLNCNMQQISIKARSNEGLDAVGGGEAIAAHAVVLLQKKKGGCVA